jgi:hypothetical protein
MSNVLNRFYSGIALIFVVGMVFAIAAAAAVRLIFSEAPIGDLVTAILGLFGVPIGVVIAGKKDDESRSYLVPAVVVLSVCWTLAVIGVVVAFDLQAMQYRQHPADCPCSLGDLTNLLSKQFPKANAILSLVLGAIFASGGGTKPPTSTTAGAA